MSTPEVRSDDTSSLESIDAKLEVVVVPVLDVDRAKDFYQRLGWRLDVTPPGVVQLTPHASRCSVQFGVNLTSAAPGSGKGYLIVSDMQAACDAPIEAGVEVGEIFHIGPDGPVSGPDPEHRSYSRGPPLAIPTATTGCCSRSRPDFPGAATLAPRRSARRATWPPRHLLLEAERRSVRALRAEYLNARICLLCEDAAKVMLLYGLSRRRRSGG